MKGEEGKCKLVHFYTKVSPTEPNGVYSQGNTGIYRVAAYILKIQKPRADEKRGGNKLKSKSK